MIKYLSVFLLTILSYVLADNPKDTAANAYVEKYKDLAVIEMYRSGIPASITLAQALHESGVGNSDLAVNANNHFGIKCKSYWKGGTYNHKDDDYDKNGNLIKSCFRYPCTPNHPLPLAPLYTHASDVLVHPITYTSNPCAPNNKPSLRCPY